MNPFYFLIYASVPRNLHASQTELTDLLDTCRRINTPRGITGLLLYKEGLFLQLLEGPEPAVKQIYAKIFQDSRHHSCMVINEGVADQRLFPDWSMGFHDLTDPQLAERPGFSQFMNQPKALDHFPDDPDGCMRLLRLFRESM